MQSKVRWGILGAGSIARKFAAGLQSLPDAKLQAVASLTPSRLDEFTRHFNVPRAYSRYEDLVDDEDIDIIYIATINHLHKSHSMLCLGAGKPVLCEKPFTVNGAEAREVIALARSKKMFCMEAMWMRFVPVMARLREILHAGTIGEIRMVTVDLGFPAPFEKDNRFFNRHFGGGAMLDLGIYPVSFLSFVLGKPAFVSSRACIGVTGIDEQSAAIFNYSSGALGIMSTSLITSLPGEAVICGTKGRVRVHASMLRPSKLSLAIFPETGSLAKAPPVISKAYGRIKKIFGGNISSTPVQSIVLPVEGNGYNYEAAEAMRCLRSGELESSIMPLNETQDIMDTLDQIRGQWTSHSSGITERENT